ncbi:MAG: YebC/PmpR family DNA-binding transcriptional regulator [Pseudomonadales bacterium]|jgi:YebC/PmpR family DNA-binding regulatory protein|uniref:YebC/PmpR family DNA-binding transcriptional regulator n=1 Tax=Halopseudomonas aestusnigri TaxID=857252 RepID=UPI000C545B0E|nr:YebC/PmpR family DNA-binding transcriptional regulator [Halopseudomonas aestusnigri]MAK74735.1 YebC/PmpR family DNA-binding transcriptional regulator [Pseudomonadales bacterium]MEE2798045.1 YebC/PmpR family DNA-binding transcriptional regulator [Pseudomonadota bacterium]HBT57853.1 YebC/PmpR family DNA-binding transcriptional regulator [Pseudomonas sp.]MAY07890.1 YebC/PmpR family DNA-binding transcriptional regulator [Pseudomonadales bacterium]MBP76132.1 YebC/PmpR family DNA-binding transcri|tara:strand:+ start:12102 stop:12848 length:747 start_codon:yes stop_codon:yes gene_type:complete
MAGHSKWANIKHRKAAQDAKRGKIFTKLIRELTVSAKVGGGNPADNPRLRAAVDKALGANMTRDTIDRAIARGAGSNDADNMEELTYEGYGAGGVAVLVEAMTDNRNRTVSEVRHAFSKCGGNLGTDGSVAYLFTRRGQLTFSADADEESLMEAALESGAEDFVTNDDGSFDVFTSFEEFGAVRDALEAAGFAPESAEVTMVPSTQAELDLDTAQKVVRLIDMLEDLDDVQNVYSNASISDDIMEQLG